LSQLTIHRDAWDDAKELGLTLTLPQMVSLSARTDSTLGHRRYKNYYFVIEGSEVIAVNKPGHVHVNRNEVDDTVPPGPSHQMHMTCPVCVGTDDNCDVCENTRSVTGTKQELLQLLKNNL
jgi:mannose-6-phosphate isomerase-like protein (cupin superfamily)